MFAALPPHHDDDVRRSVWRGAAGGWLRYRFRAAASAGRDHHRRPDDQPVADAVHHAGRVSVVRPAGSGAASPARAENGGGDWRLSRILTTEDTEEGFATR